MFKIFFIIFVVLLLVLLYCFFIAKAPKQEKILWGVNFSQMQAQNLGLDWRRAYLALIEDLSAKNIKLMTNWDFVEGQKGQYYFGDIDWQIQQAEKHNVSLIYVVGMKTGRWPECHIPLWANDASKQAQQDAILKYIKTMVVRYKDSKSIIAWQAENEPLFDFGQCPWYDPNFLTQEVALIKSLDATRPVIISDSGEQSFWFGAARAGDIVSTTMYRKLWFHVADGVGFYGTFPIPAISYWYKAELVKWVFNKSVFCGELQAEPWSYKVFSDVSLEEQDKTMSLQKFKENISYAKSTGLNEFYFWGAEWWYWLKTTQNQPQIWDYAKELLK